MLWPKYSKYEYCYKFSNSKIRDFGTGRGGKLESIKQMWNILASI